MSDHVYNPDCGCPGCQFMWAAEETYRKHGSAPVIGTFEPRVGDVGRDCDASMSPLRVMTADGRWHPYFEVLPRMVVPDGR